MKKQKYTLDVMEQELGQTIDSINNDTKDAKVLNDPKDLPAKPALLEPISLADHPEVVEQLKEKEKLIMKNIWVPESVDCQIKLIRAVRQRQRLPNKFNDIANEALVEYIQRHLNEELQSSSE
jgi:hypothetical protein